MTEGVHAMTRKSLWLPALCAVWLALFTLGCDSGASDPSDGDLNDGDLDAEQEPQPEDGDLDAELDGESEVDDDAVEQEDEMELDGDAESEVEADAEGEEEIPTGLPDELDIAYSRVDAGEPVSDEEVTAFTRRLMGFLKKIHYFDYVLYTTHGVDASTGLPDWQFWYNERFKKEGDLVTFFHPENMTDGGHNLHIPMSRVTGDLLAAAMLTNDATASLAAEKLCKGITASMLGMVQQDGDPLPHLMSRNVVPAYSQEFLTHDGKRKAVDPSGWYSEYERWNCNRYHVADNPWWGEMWVTNLRSKDDVPHVFRFVPVLRYAVRDLQNEAARTACAETLSYLEAFAKDIVDSDYRIRTREKDGAIVMPGFTDDPELNKLQGDLASFIHYREFIPLGECNARRGSELIAYRRAVNEECGTGEPNAYDRISYSINAYNRRICQYFHVAHLANALVNRDNAAALELMEGVNTRIAQEYALELDEMKYPPNDMWRNLALLLTQAHSFGFPLVSEDVRLIHYYYQLTIDQYLDWPYWDLWAESVPEGATGAYRPPNCDNAEGVDKQCWFRVEDIAQIFENCWSPLVNPTSASFVDCDIVRDPDQWDEADAVPRER
jgi:hypothetical protein